MAPSSNHKKIFKRGILQYQIPHKKPTLPGTGLHHLNTDIFTNQYTDIINVKELFAWQELYWYKPIDQPELSRSNNAVDTRLGQHWKYLVHMMRDPDKLRPEFFSTRFEDIIQKWDVMSTSLVSNEKNSAVGYFGFILDVPPENILSTNYKDIGFYNHAGIDWVNNTPVVKDKNALVHHINEKTNRLIQNPAYILSRTGDFDSHLNDVVRLNKDFPGKSFPNHFIASRSSYNEIVIVSRPGVVIHPQPLALIGATKRVYVKGIYVMNNSDYIRVRHYRLINQLAILNRVPVLYIRQNGPIYTAPDKKADWVGDLR
ncbi:MAG: hypothetical protein E6Q66_05440 [Pedobacter sp.]|nr:MAG: hypothetical protein E6Q66_05440 [Pedobacter sp.]